MNILEKLILLFLGFFILGSLLTLILFKFDLKKIHEQRLDYKILMWLPIAAVFLLIIFTDKIFALLIFLAILIAIASELASAYRKKHFTFWYPAFLVVSFLHIPLLARFGINPNILIYLVVSTAISDICGFFFGNFFGKHKLPEQFNNKKSWEGVFGQLAGALAGALLVTFILGYDHKNIWLFLPIGVGSAIGDLFNSKVKRTLDIKDWGSLLPGHGGFTDRFCSLAGSALLTLYFYFIFR